MQYVPDASMPADFLTKWIDKTKFARSVRYTRTQRALKAIVRGANRHLTFFPELRDG